MQIYFTAAIVQKHLYGHYYGQIIELLTRQGHKVVHEHITQVSLSDIQSAEHKRQRQVYYRKVMRWIARADVVVAEISFPSTINVGYEVTHALSRGKPVIALYQGGNTAYFLEGLKSDKFFYVSYLESTLEKVLTENLAAAGEQINTRFNFFLPASLATYLDWISAQYNVPRSVYLRQLIEADLSRHRRQYYAELPNYQP